MQKVVVASLASCAVIGSVLFALSRSRPAALQAGPSITAEAGKEARGPVAPRPATPAAVPEGKRFKVLHIMSYDASWTQWTVPLFDSFKEQLKDLPVEYQVIEMDVKRNTSEQWKKEITEKACAAIDTWKPDLVYTTDDFVQSSVVSRYLNSETPFVFSGVNAEPARYRFTGTKNITGVLEREHIVQTARLLVSVAPQVRRLAIITDAGETWPGVMQRIKAAEKEMGLTIVAMDVVNTYAEYQAKIASYAGTADAICTLGIFTLKGEDGRHVPMETVGRWTYEQCALPNMSFWDSRIPLGATCVVYVSPTAQGEAAGAIARGILVEGKRPSEFAITATLRGKPMVNLAAARRLKLNPPSSVLLSSTVSTQLQWE